ncbi:cell division protein FtsX [Candidatus Magnetominusculus xianensis]|uniref:Cell division protein FtsX n=1 Tax=Candidatus Magnetominusculus xianensis TaxID=1748249 RepID=A0ABR5SFZ7_9BACT|nr:permease-like cell division protein FtsX [Candidatus Magnetominusculus xianensis]KWT84422.1 cell division protein FtsX [Candidatus Magnetominusculus xianensis]MBF0404256.1 ABC transporter permease [Nitrospirota bacterium]
MFSLKLAFQSIVREKWMNLLSMLSIGVMLFILVAVAIIVYNVEKLTVRLPERLTVMVILKEGVTSEENKSVLAAIKADPAVKSIVFVSKEKALDDLKKSLKKDDFILKGFVENPLFDSFDVKIKSEGIRIDEVKRLIQKIKSMKAVEDVEYGELLMDSIYALKRGLRALGLSIGIIFVCSVTFICYTTVKILFYRHRDEIEVYKLLGATRWFVRAPFFLEGSIIGIFGGVLGSGMLMGFYHYFFRRLVTDIPMFAFISIPLQFLYLLPVCGMLLGLGGSVLALGRLKY